MGNRLPIRTLVSNRQLNWQLESESAAKTAISIIETRITFFLFESATGAKNGYLHSRNNDKIFFRIAGYRFGLMFFNRQLKRYENLNRQLEQLV